MVILGPRKVPVFSGFFDSCVQKTFWPPGDMKMCTQNFKNPLLKFAFSDSQKNMRKKRVFFVFFQLPMIIGN